MLNSALSSFIFIGIHWIYEWEIKLLNFLVCFEILLLIIIHTLPQVFQIIKDGVYVVDLTEEQSTDIYAGCPVR